MAYREMEPGPDRVCRVVLLKLREKYNSHMAIAGRCNILQYVKKKKHLELAKYYWDLEMKLPEDGTTIDVAMEIPDDVLAEFGF